MFTADRPSRTGKKDQTMNTPKSSLILPSRRDALRFGAAGAVAAGLGPMQAALGDCVVTASETEGPYWVDEMLSRSDIRSDPATGVLQAGFPLRLGFNLSELTGPAC